MTPFFTISITEYERHRMQLLISWPDLPNPGSASLWVTDPEIGICEVMKIQRLTVADILRRYIDQRYNALKDTRLKVQAAELFFWRKRLSGACSLGDLCRDVRPKIALLKLVLPGHSSIQSGWRDVILPLLEFIETYRAGDARTNTIQIITPFKSYYHGNRF